MVLLIVVLLLAFATFVLVTVAIVRGVPRIVWLSFGALALAMALLGVVYVYQEFHPSDAFISRSTANPHWAVDCTLSGFRDVGYDFRVHDFHASPFSPLYIADLFWEDLYDSGDLYWSRDGTVAAATILLHDHREVFAAAYDFSSHRAVRSGFLGVASNDSKDVEIRQLLESRGGAVKTSLPSFKKL